MRGLQVNEKISLNEVINLRPCDAKNRYRLSQEILFDIANEIGAEVRIGRRRLLHRPTMDEYFAQKAE